VAKLLRAGALRLFLVGDARDPRLRDVTWGSGGRVLQGDEEWLAEMMLARGKKPALSLPNGESAFDWSAMDVPGEATLWIGRFAGRAPADANARGDASHLQALSTRSRALGGGKLGEKDMVAVITPMTSALVLESEAAYRRWGIARGGASAGNAQDSGYGGLGVQGIGLGGGGGLGWGGYGTIGTGSGTGAIGTGSGTGAIGTGSGTGAIGTGSGYGTIGTGSGTKAGYGGHRGLYRQRTQPPKISLGKASVRGDLDKTIIRRYLRRRLPQIRYCYEKELLRSPKLAGRATAEFTIESTGRVSSAKVTGLGNRAVESCLQKVLRTMQFPQAKGGGIVLVKYPFEFNADGSFAALQGKWLLAAKDFANSKSLQNLAKLLDAPALKRPESLAWWLVENKLRTSSAPVEAYALVAELLRAGSDKKSAQRILSEAAPLDPQATSAHFRRLGWPEQGKRVEALADL
jgi:hypothetical protein